MLPSVRWGTDYVRLFGANIRSGASDINDPDFTAYPAFHFNQLTGSAVGQNSNPYMHTWFIKENKFPLNQPIDDWSIAYTAVDNSELSHNNIGVFDSADYTSPKYKNDNSEQQKIAFINNLRYCVNINDHGARPRWAGVPQFPKPPYSNNLYVYSPGATGTTPDPVTMDLSQVNYNGYATTIRSFGIKTLFLEIRVSTAFIGGSGDSPLPNDSYSLKEYIAMTQQARNANPISRAFARIYVRNSTSGTYDYNATDFFKLYPVLSSPFAGDGLSSIYCHFNLITAELNPNVTLELPLFGIPVERSTFENMVYITPQSGFLDFFYGWDKISGVKSRDTDSCIFYMLPTEENIEYLRKCCAAYGLFFCESIITSDNKDLSGGALEANNGRWLHNDMFLGIIEDNGYTQGRYTRGLQNGMQTQFNWTDSSESIYDPDIPPTPPSPYDDHTVFNDIGNIASLTRRYALTAAAVEELGSELWTISADLINNIQNDEWNKYTAEVLDTFLVNDPLSCIVSLQKYPMSLPEQSGPVHVKLGKAETNIEANITSATTHTYAFTPQLIEPKYGNSFLDYEPYTHMELYVPFCGTISLDPRDYLGHYLNIRLVVDFTTGTCVAYIMSDDLVIDTVNGSLAVSIPVTGIDSTTLAANITNGIINTRNARYSHIFGTLGKIASPRGILSNISNVWGSAEAILSSEENARAAEYSLSHQTAPPHTIGSASPVGSWAIDFSARLLIYYPTGEVIDNSKQYLAFNDAVLYRYMDQVGIATIDPVDNVGSKYRGLIAATAPVLENMVTATGEPATDPELQLIARALEEGIII
jgi:hypothetical protein